jgi:hypothetical protein
MIKSIERQLNSSTIYHTKQMNCSAFCFLNNPQLAQLTTKIFTQFFTTKALIENFCKHKIWLTLNLSMIV